jgi:phospholipid transport system transporter-binding protein
MNNITQLGKQWYVTGSVLMDNVNAVLRQSAELSMEEAVTVDFSAVTDLDTSAISLIMEWQRRAAKSGCDVIFVNLPESLISLASLYGVTEFIPSSAS